MTHVVNTGKSRGAHVRVQQYGLQNSSCIRYVCNSTASVCDQRCSVPIHSVKGRKHAPFVESHCLTVSFTAHIAQHTDDML